MYKRFKKQNKSHYSLCLCSHHQDAPVEAQVRQALARPRVAHALRPSAGSSHRITGNLRSAKWSSRREERYRIISRSRTELLDSFEPHKPLTDVPAEETEKGHKCPAEIQVVDLLHEDGEDQGVSPSKVGWLQYLVQAFIWFCFHPKCRSSRLSFLCVISLCTRMSQFVAVFPSRLNLSLMRT